MDLKVSNNMKKATKVYFVLNKTIFEKINRKTKVPEILYGAETWSNQKKDESINATEMKHF